MMNERQRQYIEAIVQTQGITLIMKTWPLFFNEA